MSDIGFYALKSATMIKEKRILGKLKIYKDFLKVKALILHMNNSLNVLHWEGLMLLFNKEESTPGKLF